METRHDDAPLRIDHEQVKARAVALRNEAIDAAWMQLVSKVSGWFAGLRLDATSPSGGLRTARFGHSRHRPG